MDMKLRHAPFELINPDGDPGWLLTCDHASNRVPEEVAPLGLGAHDMERHIAWDPGARGVTLALSEMLNAPAVLSTWSRLVIDPNRGDDDPTRVPRIADGALVPGNAGLDGAEIARRAALFVEPYHAQIAAALDRALARGVTPIMIAIHSMTARLLGGPDRPWQISILYAQDTRIGHALLERLRQEPDLRVGDNEPYHGALAGDSMARHGLARGLPHALIELRNDLIATGQGQRRWAGRLAGALRDVAARYHAGEL